MEKSIKDKLDWLNTNFPLKEFKVPKIDYSNKWKPMFKPRPVKYGGGIPSSPDIQANSKQLNLIFMELDNQKIDAYKVVFVLNNREDGKIREKTLYQLDKGDCCDILNAIKRGKVKQVIKEEIIIK